MSPSPKRVYLSPSVSRRVALIVNRNGRNRRVVQNSPFRHPPSSMRGRNPIHDDCSGVPLAVGKIRGVRSFTIRRSGKLGPAVYTDKPTFIWEPGTNTCYCNNLYAYTDLEDEDGRLLRHGTLEWWDYTQRLDRNQICDDENHSCGLWAYYDGSHFNRAPWMTSGIIEGYGRTEIGPKGFRSSKADLIAIVCRDRLMWGFYALIVASLSSAIVFARTGEATTIVMGLLNGLSLGVFFILCRSGVAGFNWRALRRMRKYYKTAGVKVYSFRWYMLKKHPVDKVRSEWESSPKWAPDDDGWYD